MHTFSLAHPSWIVSGVLRYANVTTAIPMGAPSLDRDNYRPVSITSIPSKVYEKLVSHKLSSFCEKYGLLPDAQFAYRTGLGCTAYHISSPSEVL